MYPHWRALLPNLSFGSKVSMGLFSYGFYRAFRAEYKPPHDLIGYRLGFGFFNGVLYLIPPYSVFTMVCMINRAEVAYMGKDPKNYPMIYHEFWGAGYNEHVL
jgi:hypothetical protein